MIVYLLIAVFSYLMGILNLILFSIINNKVKYSRFQKKKEFVDYGKMAYEELEKREIEENSVLKE